MIGDIIVNKKGEPQLDKFGQELYVGQPVIIMDACGYSGSRSTMSTGLVVGFDRYLIVLKDTDSGLQHQSDAVDYAKFLEDKANKKCKTWKNDWEEVNRRGLDHWPDKVTSQYVIGCTEKVRRGFRDGSLFKE